jgi:hypothetical protein
MSKRSKEFAATSARYAAVQKEVSSTARMRPLRSILRVFLGKFSRRLGKAFVAEQFS